MSQSLEENVVALLRQYRRTLEEQAPRRVHQMVMNEVERAILSEVLNWTDYNQIGAAQILGIHRNTLRAKIKQYNIKIPPTNEEPDEV